MGQWTLFTHTEATDDSKDHAKDLCDECLKADHVRVVYSVEVSNQLGNARAIGSRSPVNRHSAGNEDAACRETSEECPAESQTVRVTINDVVGCVSAEDSDCLFDLAHNCSNKSSKHANDSVADPLGESIITVTCLIYENLRSDKVKVERLLMLEDVVFTRIDFIGEARIHLHFICTATSHFFSSFLYLIIITIMYV